MPLRGNSGSQGGAKRRVGSRARQRGVTAIEYALIAALIAAVIIGALTLTGGNLQALYDGSTNSITSAINKALGP